MSQLCLVARVSVSSPSAMPFCSSCRLDVHCHMLILVTDVPIHPAHAVCVLDMDCFQFPLSNHLPNCFRIHSFICPGSQTVWSKVPHLLWTHYFCPRGWSAAWGTLSVQNPGRKQERSRATLQSLRCRNANK